MSEIQFLPGQFHMFRVIGGFHLGVAGKDLPDGLVIEFDGATVRFGGETYNSPALRGIIGKWLVPVNAPPQAPPAPAPAGIKVRPATSTGAERGEGLSLEATTEEEQEVGTLADTIRRRDEANNMSGQALQDKYSAVPPAQVQPPVPVAAGTAPAQQPSAPVPPAPVMHPNMSAPATAAPLPVTEMPAQVPFQAAPQAAPPTAPHLPVTELLPQPHTVAAPLPVTVPRVRTVEEADAINAARIAAAMNQPVAGPPRDPDVIPGMRRDSIEEGGSVRMAGGKFPVLTGDALGQEGVPVKRIISQGGAAVGSEGVAGTAPGTNFNQVSGRDIDATIKPIGGGVTSAVLDVPPDAEPATPEAVLLPPTKTATLITDQTPIDSTLDNGAVGDVAEIMEGSDLADILPGAAVAGSTKGAFTWDRKRHWRNRVRDAVDNYGDKPDMIARIEAVETDGVIKHINAELARRG